MFEHFDPRALECVRLAQGEARRLGHDEVGTVHLLLAVAGVAPQLLGVSIEAVRASVVALEGSAPVRDADGMIALTAEAKAALEGANAEALRRGHTIIDPAHLLLALLDAGGGATRALREAGAIPGDVRERANATAGAGPQHAAASREPADHAQALRDGHPVMVALADERRPIGDLGHPRVDAHLLELMLVKDTPAARLLREHGIDEARLRAAFGDPPPRR
jgi:ATP-dependent Clp protease ATP-binding subunit ClpA